MPNFWVEVGNNVRVSYSKTVVEARSESILVASTKDPRVMVGASKKFTSLDRYEFSLICYFTSNAGETWGESAPLPLPPNTDGVSDPALCFDPLTEEFVLVGLPFFGEPTTGLLEYRSKDGAAWRLVGWIHEGDDDKQSLDCDQSASSQYRGTKYLAWDGEGGLCFARQLPGRTDWTGIQGKPAGAAIPGNEKSFSPEIAITEDGVLTICWLDEGGGTLYGVRSTNGGDTFTGPFPIATGIKPLENNTSTSAGNTFPGATFRVYTIPTICPSRNGLVAAWADMREGHSRIYTRRSADGLNWDGPDTGTPLPTNAPAGVQDFHPQLSVDDEGRIACAFYRFGDLMPAPHLPKHRKPGIDVMIAATSDGGATWPAIASVTTSPWDPAINAPHRIEGKPLTFLGEYFGLAASPLGFFPFWTDTRTGSQEIFTARAQIVYQREISIDRSPWKEAIIGAVDAPIVIIILKDGRVIIKPPSPPPPGFDPQPIEHGPVQQEIAESLRGLAKAEQRLEAALLVAQRDAYAATPTPLKAAIARPRLLGQETDD